MTTTTRQIWRLYDKTMLTGLKAAVVVVDKLISPIDHAFCRIITKYTVLELEGGGK